MFRRIWALVIKEFLAVLKDPKSRFVVLGPPVIQLLVFGYAATFDLDNVRLAVYDEDNTVASRQLLAKFTGSPTFHELHRVTHEEQIAPLLDDRKVLLLVHVRQRFEADLLAGPPRCR